MPQPTTPFRIVILGAGFGGVYVFRHLRKFLRDDPDVRLTIVNPVNYFLFTPMLHEVATGGLSPEHIVEPIRNVLRCCHEEFVLADAYKVVPAERKVATTVGELSYDILVLALGAETDFYGMSGAREHTLTLKSLEDAIRLKNRIIRLIEEASRMSAGPARDALIHFAIVGGGPTGTELAAELSEFLYGTFERFYPREDFISRARISLIEKGEFLIPQFAPVLRERAWAVLRKKRVDVRLGARVKKIENGTVVLDSGESLAAKTIVWVAGVRPREIVFEGMVEKDPQGRLAVDSSLALKGYRDIFAIGDAAYLLQDGHPLPARAQVATREAAHAASNIIAAYRKKPLRDFRYRHNGDLLSLGQWMAVAEVRGWFFSGRFAWWLWRTVYLLKLISWEKKVKVAVDWTVNLFMPRDISEL